MISSRMFLINTTLISSPFSLPPSSIGTRRQRQHSSSSSFPFSHRFCCFFSLPLSFAPSPQLLNVLIILIYISSLLPTLRSVDRDGIESTTHCWVALAFFLLHLEYLVNFMLTIFVNLKIKIFPSLPLQQCGRSLRVFNSKDDEKCAIKKV